MSQNTGTEDVSALLSSIEAAGWDYARIELDGLTLVVSTDPALLPETGTASTAPARLPPTEAARGGTRAPEEDVAPELALPGAADAAAGQPDSEARDVSGARDVSEARDVATVASPSIGLFWRSPKPGAPPFVEVGQRVSEEDTVCLIEVMKLMTHVKAGHTGVVARIHPTNGEMVEFGTALVDIARP